MRRPPSILLNAATTVPLVLLVAFGCASPPRTNPGGDRRFSLAPPGRLRFDGVYECRGIEVLGRSYLSGVLQPEPVEMHLAMFLKFAPDGTASQWLAEEPVTSDEAARALSGPDGGRDRRGPYTLDGSNLSVTLHINPDSARPLVATYTGRVYADRLEVRFTGPDYTDVRQQYRFVRSEPPRRR